MKQLVILFIILFIYHAECDVSKNINTNDYWFMDYISEVESDNFIYATNINSGALGKWQIMTNNSGALAQWNLDNPQNKYTAADMFDEIKNRNVASNAMRNNLKTFDGCIVKSINSFNMGAERTKVNEFYYPYCRDILGYMMVSNWLDDYLVIRKSKNKKVWFLRGKN